VRIISYLDRRAVVSLDTMDGPGPHHHLSSLNACGERIKDRHAKFFGKLRG
jgi:hypothetical protein